MDLADHASPVAEDDNRSSSADLQRQILEQLSTLTEKVDALVSHQQPGPCQPAKVAAGSKADKQQDNPTGWERQKAKLLREHASGSARTDQNVADTLVAQVGSKAEDTEQFSKPDQAQESDTPQETSATEPPDILELRRRLEEKLRQSEIEISIERAKLARLKQRLDEDKAEMERDFSRKHEELKNAKKKLKSRWTRFLARRH